MREHHCAIVNSMNMNSNTKIKSAQDPGDVKITLINTIKQLLSGGLNYERVMNIKGILGVTLDDHEILMIDIEEVIRNETAFKPSKSRRKSTNVTKLRAAEINNCIHTSDGEEVEEEEFDSPRLEPRCEEGSSSGRSSVDTQSGSCGSLSVPQPQRFVQNTEFWCPESEASENSENGTIVVEPSAVDDEIEPMNGSATTNGHEDSSNHHENTPNPPSMEAHPSHQVHISDDLKRDSRENGQQEIPPTQSNGPCNDEPINLSRSVSRDSHDAPQDLVVKKEPEELKPPMSVPMPFPYVAGNGVEPDFHTMWLRNMADKKDRMVPLPPPQLMMTPEGVPFAPALLDQRPHMMNANTPYVLNTPQMPQQNAKKPRRKREAGNNRQGSSPTSPQATTSSKTVGGNRCHNCESTITSTWRRNEEGQLVCNPCGLYFRLHKVATPPPQPAPRGTSTRQSPSSTSSSSSSSAGGQRCSNCSTDHTTMWRRNMDGEPVCNACGLYYKLHQVNRPRSMVKNEIHSRKRKPRRNTAGGASAAKQVKESHAPPPPQHQPIPDLMPRMPPFMHGEMPLSSPAGILAAVSAASSRVVGMSPAGVVGTGGVGAGGVLATTSSSSTSLSPPSAVHASLPAFLPTTPNTSTTSSSSGANQSPTTPTSLSSNSPGSKGGEPGSNESALPPPPLLTPPANKEPGVSS